MTSEAKRSVTKDWMHGYLYGVLSGIAAGVALSLFAFVSIIGRLQ